MSHSVKRTDKKGRVLLPKRFADATVMIENIDETEVRIKLAKVIPLKELWLFQNPEALEMVRQGLEEAKNRDFAETPDLAADLARFSDDEKDEAVDEDETEAGPE